MIYPAAITQIVAKTIKYMSRFKMTPFKERSGEKIKIAAKY